MCSRRYLSAQDAASAIQRSKRYTGWRRRKPDGLKFEGKLDDRPARLARASKDEVEKDERMTRQRLSNRHALVFGAGSSGEGWSNGKAAAVAYAREGAAVACIDISMAGAEQTRDIILSEGGHAVAIQSDVTQADSVTAAVDEALGALDKIDILHNNVGVTHMGGPVELDEATFAR